MSYQDWAVASADTDGFARENTDSEAERNLQGEDTQDDMVKFKCPPLKSDKQAQTSEWNTEVSSTSICAQTATLNIQRNNKTVILMVRFVICQQSIWSSLSV